MEPEFELDPDISPEDFVAMDEASGKSRSEDFDLDAIEREVAGRDV